MIVTIKSSGCLQIGFGPLIIDNIFFLFDSSYLTSEVVNRSQSGPNKGQVVSEIDHVWSEVDHIVSDNSQIRCIRPADLNDIHFVLYVTFIENKL